MEPSAALKKYFTGNLMQWHEYENVRVLPWKKESDPYKIWLSEIIMQQTRVEQGMPYYEQFIRLYPTIQDLAGAADAEVYRVWQGLGYYNRCKNLLETARHITHELGGRFPDSYDAILQLKGVGGYTAAAIASFAYRLPYAVVDGNVQRVLARYFGIETAVDTTEGKKYFQILAQDLLDKERPEAYNQAIMDFGALICKPAIPLCSDCIMQSRCFAYRNDAITLLPVKAKKTKITRRFFHFILFLHKGLIWIERRTAKDIWLQLHQPYLIESDHVLSTEEIRHELRISPGIALQYEGSELQKLSHQVITSQFYTVRLDSNTLLKGKEGFWIAVKDLKKLAFPKTIVSFFQKKGYF